MYTQISSHSIYILKSRQKNEGMLVEREGANPFNLKQTIKENKDNSMKFRLQIHPFYGKAKFED